MPPLALKGFKIKAMDDHFRHTIKCWLIFISGEWTYILTVELQLLWFMIQAENQ